MREPYLSHQDRLADGSVRGEPIDLYRSTDYRSAYVIYVIGYMFSGL